MKYKCLVFDHDDTVVNSTATIHHPCFQEYLNSRYPGRTCSLEDYFKKNFAPGFVEMCREEYGMDDAALQDELEYWRAYVENHIPLAYPGIREIMERQKAEGGLICVVSHSLEHNIRRDYKANSLPEPDAVYGWDYPPEQRKPAPFPLEDIMERFGLSAGDLLMIDDLKPGYDMLRGGFRRRRLGKRYKVHRGLHAHQLPLVLQVRPGACGVPWYVIHYYI
mgnify:CR=1 FL=1